MCAPIRDDGSTQSGVMPKEEKGYRIFRTSADILRALTVGMVHFWCILAPFNYKWEALRFGLILPLVTTLCITFSYHRNLAHRSFKLPKWLEYPFAYSAIFAIQCGGRNNVMDLKKQWFYRFLRKTTVVHILMFWTGLYLYGGLPYLTCGGGVGGVIRYNITWFINSVCHILGSRSWKTKDTSRNVWWLSVFSMGESWHNNHHAFESSARQGLEWWQIDITWYLIRVFEVLGLATDVKLPSEIQKQKLTMAR